MTEIAKIKFPRRRFIRTIIRGIIYALFALLIDFKVEGRENFPQDGPLIIVANHFSYIDPVAITRVTPWFIEFIAGTVNPGAPASVQKLPALWGVFNVYRGTVSTYALKASEALLKQGGVLVIFPEGGAWADVLRPPRPGAAFLTARTGAPLLPIGIEGLNDVFPSLYRLKRATVTIKIGQSFGPYPVAGKGRAHRARLTEIGHEIMQHIAPLIPPHRRGYYSADPAIRAAAKGTEIYPWDNATEHEMEVGAHLRAKKERARAQQNRNQS